MNFSDKNKRDGSVIASRETGGGNESGKKSVSARCASESGKCNSCNSSNNVVRRNAVTTTRATRGRSGERRSVKPCSTTQPPPDTREDLPQTGTIKRTSKNHFAFAHCKQALEDRPHLTKFSRIFTGRNEVVAKVMFLLVSVILLTGGRV